MHARKHHATLVRMKDPIIEEIRKVREEIAAEFDYDIRRIMEHSRRHQFTSGHDVVDHTSGECRVVFKAPRKVTP